MNDIEICTMSEKDIDSILSISALSFPIPWSRESFINELHNKFARYVVAKKNGIIAGYGGTWVIIDEAHITNIAVHPEYRGIGIGNTIVSSLIDLCKSEKVSVMTLEVRHSNIVAQNLYKKFGFVEEGIRKEYYEDNREDAIIMCKTDF